EIGDDRLLEHVGAAVEVPGLLRRGAECDRAVGVIAPGQAAGCDLGADSGCCIERWDANPTGAEPLGQSSLRSELDLELTGEELPGELLVFAHVRAGHPSDSAVGQEDPKAPV